MELVYLILYWLRHGEAPPPPGSEPPRKPRPTLYDLMARHGLEASRYAVTAPA